MCGELTAFLYNQRERLTMRISEIASSLDLRLENGSPDTEISGVKGIEEASTGDTL